MEARFDLSFAFLRSGLTLLPQLHTSSVTHSDFVVAPHLEWEEMGKLEVASGSDAGGRLTVLDDSISVVCVQWKRRREEKHQLIVSGSSPCHVRLATMRVCNSV